MTRSPQKSGLRLGFIALTDCAPLVAAQELGLFEAEGLSVTLSREASWANIRDKVMSGALDGAHMLAPMALACALGAGAPATAMVAPISLNANGSGITLSRRLAEQVHALGDDEPTAGGPRTAHALKRLIDRRAAAGERPLTFAVVFPFSIHNYLLRYWLADAGIDPDRDVRLTVMPPPRTAARLQAGEVDGFCVGAPWGAVAEAAGAGEMWVQASRLWRGAPDKVLGVTAAFAERRPETLQAVLRALVKAAAWADQPDNRSALAEMLSSPAYVGAPGAALRRALVEPAFALHFHAEDAGYPRRAHALWLLSQMRRWGQIGPDVDARTAAEQVYRPDLYLTAAGAVGAPTRGRVLDAEPLKPMFDGRAFDPDRFEEYLAGFPLKRRPAPAQ